VPETTSSSGDEKKQEGVAETPAGEKLTLRLAHSQSPEHLIHATAENFAKHFYDLIKGKGYDVAMVQVYETPNNCASYRQEP